MVDGKAEFLTNLDLKLCPCHEGFWMVDDVLAFWSAEQKELFRVERGFCTDLASVLRLPLIYSIWGNKAHKEAVLHDLAFRKNSPHNLTFMQANNLFLEAMKADGKPAYIYYPMYWAVVAFSHKYYHKKNVEDAIDTDCKFKCREVSKCVTSSGI